MSKRGLTLAALVAASAAITMGSTPVSAASIYEKLSNDLVVTNSLYQTGEKVEFKLAAKYVPYNEAVEYQEFSITAEAMKGLVNKFQAIEDAYTECANKALAGANSTTELAKCTSAKSTAQGNLIDNEYPPFNDAKWVKTSEKDLTTYTSFGLYSYTAQLPAEYGIIWARAKDNLGNYIYTSNTIGGDKIKQGEISGPKNEEPESTPEPAQPTELPKTGDFTRNLATTMIAIAMVSFGLYLAGVAKRMD